MKHYGDITKLDGHNLPLVDIVTGGSPCQDLSVAGKRAGLAGERSGLFMEQVRIIKEMRDESTKQLRLRGSNEYIRPRYMVWENVPGAFSSNHGEDFRAVLEETAKVCDKNAIIPRPENGKWTPSGCIMGDGWSIAWRVHDAQFWGVPQRRKRIALVADFGGNTAPKILFESEGLSGDSETSREEGQEVAGIVGENIDKAISFQERAGKPGGARDCLYNMSEQEPCLPSTTKVYCLQGNGIDRADTAGCNGKGWREDQSYTLNTIDRPAVCECYSQDAYDKYSESAQSATIKQSGGVYGGGQRSACDTVGALCAVDYKGAGNQYVTDGKLIIQNIRKPSE